MLILDGSVSTMVRLCFRSLNNIFLVLTRDLYYRVTRFKGEGDKEVPPFNVVVVFSY